MRLFREIGLFSTTFIVVGNIVGIGIFTTSGLIAAEMGSSIWLIGVWILGGALALLGASCYSLLSLEWPQAGGEYAYLYPTYGPLVAFLAGWASLLIGFSAPLAASALGLAAYLGPLLPLQTVGQPLAQKLIAELALVSVTVLLSLGLSFGSRLHSIITTLNLLFIVGFASLVLIKAPVGQNLEEAVFPSPLAFPELSSLASATVMVMFAYSGWNAAAYIAEEVINPQRYIPRALLWGTGIVIVVYVLVNLAYFGGVPLVRLQGEIAVADVVAAEVLGPQGTILVNALILFSILSSITAMSIAGPRVYFAMSRHRLFPGWLAEVDSKRKIPLKSIWFQSGVAMILVAITELREILVYSGFVLLLFATLTVSALYWIKRKRPIYRFTVLYRLFPAIFILTNAVILFNAAGSYPKESVAGLVTVALGLPGYFYYRQHPADPAG